MLMVSSCQMDSTIEAACWAGSSFTSRAERALPWEMLNFSKRGTW